MQKNKHVFLADCATQNNLIAEACYCHSKEHLFNQMWPWKITLNFTISIFQRKMSVLCMDVFGFCIRTTLQSSYVLLNFPWRQIEAGPPTAGTSEPSTASHTSLSQILGRFRQRSCRMTVHNNYTVLYKGNRCLMAVPCRKRQQQVGIQDTKREGKSRFKIKLLNEKFLRIMQGSPRK